MARFAKRIFKGIFSYIMAINRGVNNILVTGGAGFMGSAFIRYILKMQYFSGKVINLDALTYAGNKENLLSVENDKRYVFVKGNICDENFVSNVCDEYDIDTIVNFAAETHVDNSITGPKVFVETNVVGTFTLLQVVKQRSWIHFHHISTDEVYGSLTNEGGKFDEDSPYLPNSPYAASKASSDHLVRSYFKTYNLSTTISHSTNNYGPCQHFEKLIPHMILKCLKGQSLPVYGKGVNVRDWLFVDDHAEAIWHIITRGEKGEVYCVGGGAEMRNIDIIHLMLEYMSSIINIPKGNLEKLITFVKDRPGHDLRYAINFSKIQKELSWQPRHDIEEGLSKTIEWYLKYFQKEQLCDAIPLLS
jgi:dTDP-glucose 4,6-dehydratase